MYGIAKNKKSCVRDLIFESKEMAGCPVRLHVHFNQTTAEV